MRQLELAFQDLPSPSSVLWDQLDDQQRAAVLELLTRLIAQIAHPSANAEEPPNE